MSKEAFNPDQGNASSQEPADESSKTKSGPGEQESVFDSPNKVVLPPDTREDAINRGDIEEPTIGTRRGSNLSAYGEGGRRARRGSKE